MNSIRRSLVGFSLLGVILLAGAPSPAQAQTTSVGPYYAMPSWDQTLPAATRFIILSNFSGAAVLDRNTGLVWERSPSPTQVTWPTATFDCIKKNVGGQKGWRLPSVVELTSLIDPNATADPFLPVNHPFTNLQPTLINWFWSATTYAPDPAVVWMVVFPDGSVTTGFKTSSSRPWCVRGGMNADQY